MTTTALLGFAGLCLLLAITPGPDTFLVLRYSLSGVRPGVAAAIGSGLGSVAWAAAVALGLSAFLQNSASAFVTVKVAGGLYLLYLGLVGFRSRQPTGPVAESAAPKVGPALRSGLFSCALNPKVGLFFLAVVPQFLPAHAVGFHMIMLLGVIDGVVAVIWLVVVAVGAARAVLWLRKPRVTRTLDLTSSLMLAVLGAITLLTVL
ncbi:LysE family translocator [Actinokineospora diospyrosa]|uniref:Threonine/homoserine/homoserine lactone efflux protein n=1 Tax=Actinokineospora diospyrosa TaxID=103728 RepID=A0ABT1IIV3_9PSEU|nr:LysE family translocator [Actinokineospora diospyrosa]MCP2272589.1 Threonine/homoserine/homoserine lactone efflux protein [Actinokineospora diospyrosa]